jgi:branched-chain amino acid aminotransferase
MSEQVYLNGEIVAADRAALSVFDSGLSHGAGLFETLRTYAGRPFRLDAHLARMRRSAERLSIPCPWDDGELRHALTRLLQINELADARVRITITPGNVREGVSGEAPRPSMLIAAQKMEPYPTDLYRQGMTVCISSFRLSRTDPLAGHKTVSYFPRLLALREAQRKQCGEALWFTTDNQLAEGCISNVFLVRGETGFTPPIDTPILPGIAREVVLECAEALRVAVEQRPLTIDDLLAADEVFLTNSIMEVMPICRVERHAVGDEKVGEITRRLHEAYRDVVVRECQLCG